MKLFLFFLLLGISTISVSAQDTIVKRQLPNHYYSEQWLSDSIDHGGHSCSGGQTNGWLRGKEFTVKGSLEVIGLAVSPGLFPFTLDWDTTDPDVRWTYDLVMDKSFDNAYEYLSIYVRDTAGEGLVCISDSLCFHIRDSVPAYIMDLDLYMDPGCIMKFAPALVYEMYFDESITLQDTFWVCMTQRSHKMLVTDDDDRLWPYSSFPIDLSVYVNDINTYEGQVSCGQNNRWIFANHIGCCFLFPIMKGVPRGWDDYPLPPIHPSQRVDPFNESIGEVDDRVLQISVREGCIVVQGLAAGQRAEVYDMLGRRVAVLAADGRTAPLPLGVYMVRTGQTRARKVVVLR
ncbi:MAG: hypothetical protein K6E96_04590 [Bacteroidales bacterium]|nr:hypothetical protein [Bacteroidales bacterium]